MNKKLYLLLILFCMYVCIGISVNAAECQQITESNIRTYFAIDYEVVTYCSGSRNLKSAGCFPLTIASILKSYGKDYTPVNVSSYLCEHYQSMAQNAQYGTILIANDVKDEFGMDIEKIDSTMTAINNTLASGKSVLASINSNSIFTSGTHYIGIVLKKDSEYYIINTGSKNNAGITSGWYSKESVQQNVVNSLNNGMWSIMPRNCANTTNNGTNTTTNTEHSPSEDPYPGAGPNLDTDADVKCNKIFKKNDSDEFNDLGQFLQDVFLGIRLLAPALVIILSTIDYIKAIAASNQDNLKKVNQKTIKRVIAGLIVFFIPLLLDILFKLFGIYDLSTCGIGS